jgi:hypothetical protein
MLLKNKLRSVYSRAVHGNVIAINEHDTGRSVTNDAENVINDLVRQGFDLSPYHAIYKDTRGIWDKSWSTAPAALPVSAADFRTRLAQNKGPAIVNWGRGEEPAARRVTLLGLGNQ